MATRVLYSKKRTDVDMTDGSIIRHLVMFAMPLLLGNLFQQLYNTVDTWVVGNYVSNEAFSAVGTVGPIINMLIGFFMGLSSGCGVIISQYYGAKKYDRVNDASHTAIMLTFILCMVFTAIGIGMTPTMLGFMKTPAEVYPEAKRYLTIYFSGITGLLIYNMGSAVLRAIGDSKRPFIYLVVSACVNIVLDLVFVLVFKMGVDGVAWATVIAQAVSALLVLLKLLTTDTCVRIHPKCLKLHFDLLKKMVTVGFPAAIQMAITAFSNVFVQSYVNYFGADCMSGWTAYNKIDQLVLLPLQSVGLSVTTFVGQNLGKGREDRAKKGTLTALWLAASVTAVIIIGVWIFAPYTIRFFNSKKEVVDYGVLILRIIVPFNILGCVNHVFANAQRGAGNSRAPMFIMLAAFVLFRQIYLFFVTRFIANNIILVSLGYPMGWIMCALLNFIYYITHPLKSNLVEDKK